MNRLEEAFQHFEVYKLQVQYFLILKSPEQLEYVFQIYLDPVSGIRAIKIRHLVSEQISWRLHDSRLLGSYKRRRI
jgi:hypothetical protein